MKLPDSIQLRHDPEYARGLIADIRSACAKMKTRGVEPDTIHMSAPLYKRLRKALRPDPEAGNGHQRRIIRRRNARKLAALPKYFFE